MSDETTIALQRLNRRMAKAVENSDTEGAHGEADDILTEAVALLKHPLAEKLVVLYGCVSKWYA